jgi:hypothetical protein
MRILLLVALCASAAWADPNPPTLRSNQGAWPITRQWTLAEAEHFGKWLDHIYQLKTKGTLDQRMAKVDKIITDPAMNLLEDPAFRGSGSNPQLPAGIIRTMHHYMDCGKFTAFMPAYYAYRRGLPWITTVVASGGGDVRTADNNIPINAVNSFTTSSLSEFFNAAVGQFISGNYRVNLNGKNAQQSDTVPVAINKRYLMPGVMYYLDGHCLILAHISPYGELHFLNCSTTNTRDVYSYNAMNVVTGITPRGNNPENEWDGCYQGLRVLRYPIAITEGGVVKQVRRRTDAEMVEFGFSTEQYDVMREMWDNQSIMVDGMKVGAFHDLVRLRMKSVDRIAPLPFIEEYCDELLDAFRFRDEFVQDAWRDVQARGPITFPEGRGNENIFQAFGRWETWSSPSSDVDRRNKYFYLADWMEYAVRMYGLNRNFIDLRGLEKYNVQSQSDLARALVAEKNRIFAQKSMQYTTSYGERITLTLKDIEERLYDMSFDPNHPPEIRWGAPEGSEERARAPKPCTPVPDGKCIPFEQAYAWQAYYRCIGQRETEESALQGMFTEGFPVRDRLDQQLAKWYRNSGEPRTDKVAIKIAPAPPVEEVAPEVATQETPRRTATESARSVAIREFRGEDTPVPSERRDSDRRPRTRRGNSFR